MTVGQPATPSWEERSPFEVDGPGAALLPDAAPSPLEGEPPAGETVYVPSRLVSPGAGSVAPELRQLDDGRIALLVYSSLELLVAGCGNAQPWVAVQLAGPDAVEELVRLSGADVVLLDVEVPAAVRHEAERKGVGS